MCFIRHYYVAREIGSQSVGAKHAGAGFRDTIIKIYSEEGDLT